MHLLRVSGWVGVIIAAPALLIIGMAPALSPADLAYGHLLPLGPAEHGYFSTTSVMPGALVEPLFITDPFEGPIAASSRGQQVIAGGLARAIEQYFAPPAP